MKRQNRKACLAAMLLLPCLAWGQQRLTLDHLLQLADEQSVSIKSYSAAVESALHNEASAKATQLPDIGISASVGYLGDGLLGNRDFSSWQHISNPHFMNNFALKAQQAKSPSRVCPQPSGDSFPECLTLSRPRPNTKQAGGGGKKHQFDGESA